VQGVTYLWGIRIHLINGKNTQYQYQDGRGFFDGYSVQGKMVQSHPKTVRTGVSNQQNRVDDYQRWVDASGCVQTFFQGRTEYGKTFVSFFS
jgi:hypothetical protein